MSQRIKQFLLIAAILGTVYFFNAYHIIINERDFTLLPKSELTLEYTFVSLNKREAEDVLSDDMLREAGIGHILVELGAMSEERREVLEMKFEALAAEEE